MDSNLQHLTQYARYHRDPRNLVTHFIGIPMIVFAVAALLAPLHLSGQASFNAAWLAWGLSTLWYLRGGERRVALVTSVFIGLLVLGAQYLASASATLWLSVALGSFAIGWAFQFVGHAFEGRKPAFVDDLRGLLVGPMFMVAEAGFAAGAWTTLRQRIEAEAGPVARRAAAAPRVG